MDNKPAGDYHYIFNNLELSKLMLVDTDSMELYKGETIQKVIDS